MLFRSTTSTVSSGGVDFDAQGPETTTVSGTAPGFDATFAGASVEVTVTRPGILVQDISGPSNVRGQLGVGLQDLYRLTLDGSEHGGVTVRIASGDPGVALVSADTSDGGTTAGTSFVDVFIPDGTTTRNFVVQGVSLGSVDITVQDTTAPTPLFDAGTTTVADRKSTRLNSSHSQQSRMPSSA